MLTGKRSSNLITAMGFVLLICSHSFSFADTIVEGNVSGNWNMAGSPYLFINDCTVPTGSVLTLDPGVQVIIGEGLSLNVYGQVIAVGTESQHITFRAVNDSVKFNQIHVINGSSTPTVSEFVYCDFLNAQRGLYLHAYGRIFNEWTIMQTNVSKCNFASSVTIAVYAHGEGHDYSQYMTPRRGHARVDPVIKGCVFDGNSVGIEMYMQGDGSIYYSAGSTAAIIQNNVFLNLTGAALNMAPGSHPSHSGSPSFVNNTVVNCDRGAWIQDSLYDATMTNNIFYGTTTAIERTGTASSTAYYNCFFDNTANFVGYPATYGDIVMTNVNGDPCDLGHNIFLDPLFASDGHHLSVDSPCINAAASDGAPSIDMDGDSRPQEDYFDIGADEYGEGPPTGACCMPDGSCTEGSSSECTSAGGTYQGNGTDCASVNCAQPEGACCMPDGSCTEGSSSECTSAGGTYQGNGTDCASVNCAQPEGACCMPDGSCTEGSSSECASAGGTYQGDGTDCVSANCAQPEGACCMPDGSCTEGSSSECASAGGTYQGDGSDCASASCSSCFSTSSCAQGYYCAKPEGDCDGEGVCTPIPDNCPYLYDPICGCDGFTYANDCEAAMYGVSVAYRGECDGGSGTLCSILGNDPRPYAPDMDEFIFTGSKGETVTVTLESNPPEYGMGQRAVLIMRSLGRGLRLFKRIENTLSLEMTVTLPVSGDYHVKILESRGRAVIWGQKYEGEYCVTLEASPETVATFEPDLNVE